MGTPFVRPTQCGKTTQQWKFNGSQKETFTKKVLRLLSIHLVWLCVCVCVLSEGVCVCVVSEGGGWVGGHMARRRVSQS